MVGPSHRRDRVQLLQRQTAAHTPRCGTAGIHSPAANSTSSSNEGACAPPPSLLTETQLSEAATALATSDAADGWLSELAKQLGVPCHPEQPGYLRALAAAIARFETRTLPFITEVDGKLDDQTRRFLQMYFPPLRDETHACRKRSHRPAPRALTQDQWEQATERNGDRAGKSDGWVRTLQHVLGAQRTTGELDRSTLDRIAVFQRTLRVVAPQVQVNGVLDAPTIEALERAFPRLRTREPALADTESFFPGASLSGRGRRKHHGCSCWRCTRPADMGSSAQGDGQVGGRCDPDRERAHGEQGCGRGGKAPASRRSRQCCQQIEPPSWWRPASRLWLPIRRDADGDLGISLSRTLSSDEAASRGAPRR